MLAYHNDSKLKAKTVAAMEADIKAERLQPGHYWDGKSGCFVGCVIRGESHAKFEVQIGFPRILARLGDRLYEGLKTQKEKQAFAVDFLKAPKEGADLSSVWPKFAVFMLTDKKHGVINFTKKETTKKYIQEVSDLYQRIINGEKIDANVWLEVKNRGYAAAAYAAAYAAYAAAAAAYAADAYATYAAAAYAAAAYAAYARSRHFAALATALIKFLSEAKAPKLPSKRKAA